MTVEFKSPTETETALMREFGTLISNGIDLVVKHDIGNFGGIVVQKLQEALFWHSHALLNKSAPAKAVEGELIEKDKTVD